MKTDKKRHLVIVLNRPDFSSLPNIWQPHI